VNSTSWKPNGYSSVSPYLVVPDADAVIEFLVATLGAHPLRRYENPDGSVLHAEVRIDDTVVMMGQSGDGWEPRPCHVHLYVPDVDEAFARALANGGEPVAEPTHETGDPDRRGGVKGPGGTTWWFSTQVLDAPRHSV